MADVGEEFNDVPGNRRIIRATDLQWEDLRFPAQGIDPPGAASDPARSTTTGLLHFAGASADNIIAGVAQMPHDWSEGTLVRPHLHLICPTAAAGVQSRWKFEYNIGSPAGDFANAYGSYTTLATITVANPNNALRHILAAFGDLAMTGHTLSAMILWKITRVASDTVNDTDPNDVVLAEFDIHYQRDAMGSLQETVKT